MLDPDHVACGAVSAADRADERLEEHLNPPLSLMREFGLAAARPSEHWRVGVRNRPG